MNLKKRLLYFGSGTLLGVFFVWIIFNKKDVTFDYLPNDRVLKTLRTKKRTFNDEAILYFNKKNIDTSLIELFLKESDVNFSKSNPRVKPCNYYHLETTYQEKTLGLYLKNCDSLVIIEKAFEIN